MSGNLRDYIDKNISYDSNNFVTVIQVMDETERILDDWNKEKEIESLVEEGIISEYEELKKDYYEDLEEINVEALLYQLYGDEAAEMIEKVGLDNVNQNKTEVLQKIQEIEEQFKEYEFEQSETMDYLVEKFGTDANRVAMKLGSAALSDTYDVEQINDAHQQVVDAKEKLQEAITCVGVIKGINNYLGLENEKDIDEKIENEADL